MKIKELIKSNNLLLSMWLRGFIFLNIIFIISNGRDCYQILPIGKLLAFLGVAALASIPAGFTLWSILIIALVFIGIATENIKNKKYLEAFLLIIWMLLAFM
ncbi:hypothetical protein [Polaribacter uvawellassae]|uniref:hypothetical protein n=1 Tax=Polaribacter uvawellassae TaxID=3133495 RepID=UPI00321AB9B6